MNFIHKKRNLYYKSLIGIALVAVIIAGCILPGITKNKALADSYGSKAFYYMEYIDSHFQQRWAGTDSNANMREWLLSQIKEIGYEPNTIFCEGDSPLGWGYYSGYNIEFVKPGNVEREIVVCAHYDSVSTNGCEDNGSGVGSLLELAERLKDFKTEYSIRFILFDAEEPGMIGSNYYLQTISDDKRDNFMCVINMDCMSAGDYLYAFGGDYEDGELVRDWTLRQIQRTASVLGIRLNAMPEDNATFKSPTKITGSDHQPFNEYDIPYVYLATAYWDANESSGLRQTSDESIPNGKIMHVAEYDNWAFLTDRYSERMKSNLQNTELLMTYLIVQMGEDKTDEEFYEDIYGMLFPGRKPPVINFDDREDETSEEETSEEETSEEETSEEETSKEETSKEETSKEETSEEESSTEETSEQEQSDSSIEAESTQELTIQDTSSDESVSSDEAANESVPETPSDPTKPQSEAMINAVVLAKGLQIAGIAIASGIVAALVALFIRKKQ